MRSHIVLIALCTITPASGLVAQTAAIPTFTSEERDVIRQHILRERRPSLTTPADLVPAVGVRMLAGVELFWMPPGAGLNRYRYAVVNRRSFVLDYEDRRVIEILEPSPPQK